MHHTAYDEPGGGRGPDDADACAMRSACAPGEVAVLALAGTLGLVRPARVVRDEGSCWFAASILGPRLFALSATSLRPVRAGLSYLRAGQAVWCGRARSAGLARGTMCASPRRAAAWLAVASVSLCLPVRKGGAASRRVGYHHGDGLRFARGDRRSLSAIGAGRRTEAILKVGVRWTF